MRGALVLFFATYPLLLSNPEPVHTASKPEIDAGFRLLYELKFDSARSQFRVWQNAHPEDPLGASSEAASYLFEEFNRLGVLTSEFFLDDKKLLGETEGTPNLKYKAEFLDANRRAQDLARQRLKSNQKDAEALLVLTMTTGMLSNYAALIEKRHLKSLKLIRQAEDYAQELLAVEPDAYDAYLALGASRYIIGCLPAYKRLFLTFGGIHGDRREGMKQLAMAAKSGRYLKPYAKILLALAALRDKQSGLARAQFEELAAEFPQNPAFARELALLNGTPVPASISR
jgi:hypothetical protein